MSSFQIWCLLQVSKKLAQEQQMAEKQDILKRFSWENI